MLHPRLEPKVDDSSFSRFDYQELLEDQFRLMMFEWSPKNTIPTPFLNAKNKPCALCNVASIDLSAEAKASIHGKNLTDIMEHAGEEAFQLLLIAKGILGKFTLDKKWMQDPKNRNLQQVTPALDKKSGGTLTYTSMDMQFMAKLRNHIQKRRKADKKKYRPSDQLFFFNFPTEARTNGVTEPTKAKAEPIFAGQQLEFGVLGPDDDLSDSSEMKFATI